MIAVRVAARSGRHRPRGRPVGRARARRGPREPGRRSRSPRARHPRERGRGSPVQRGSSPARRRARRQGVARLRSTRCLPEPRERCLRPCGAHADNDTRSQRRATVFRVRALLASLSLVTCLAALGCGPGAGDPHAVVALFYPLAWAAGRVAPAGTNVVDLTPPGEPHDLELPPHDVQAVQSARLVLYLGNGFQPSVEGAVEARSRQSLDLLRPAAGEGRGVPRLARPGALRARGLGDRRGASPAGRSAACGSRPATARPRVPARPRELRSPRLRHEPCRVRLARGALRAHRVLDQGLRPEAEPPARPAADRRAGAPIGCHDRLHRAPRLADSRRRSLARPASRRSTRSRA